MESQLGKCYPDFVPTKQELEETSDELIDAYMDYIHHVSPFVMAISLETSAYILWLARKIEAQSAVDFGSGFTSYVLRQAIEDVWSVDDSPDWLEWTRRFLDRRGAVCGSLVDWDWFRKDDPRERDLVVYDFSGGTKRTDCMDIAFRCLAPGGVAVMDDAQQPLIQEAIHKNAEEFKFDVFGLGDWTCDAVQRFAALVVRP